MAWRNVPMSIGNLQQSLITDFSWVNNIQPASNKIEYHLVNSRNAGFAYGYMVGTSANGLNFETYSGNTNYYAARIYYNGSKMPNSSNPFTQNPPRTSAAAHDMTFIAVADDTTQKGIFGFLYKSGSTYYWEAGSSPSQQNYIYTFITGNEHIIYNWHSVNSVSGKIGTFNLVQTNSADISDGEAKSGKNIDVFSVLPDAVRVKNLANTYQIGG